VYQSQSDDVVGHFLNDVEYECDKEAARMFMAIFYGVYDD